MAIIKKRNDFIVGPENEYVEKGVVYKTNILVYKETLGITDEELAEDNRMIDNVITKKEAKDLAVANSSAKIADLNDARGELTPYMRTRRTKLMAHPDYTKAIGIDLGIEITYTNHDTMDMKPVASINLEGGYPAIKLPKNGTDGVRIYGRLNGEGKFAFLDVCNSTKYIDVRPKLDDQVHELREYKFYYILKGAKIGQESDVNKISF